MIFFTAIAAAALAANSPASIGSQSEPHVVRGMQRIATCIAQNREREARAMLAMDFRTPEYNRAMRRLAQGHPRCQGLLGGASALVSGGVLFAGGIAEALLDK